MSVPAGLSHDEEAESVTLGEQGLEAGRQDRTFSFGNAHRSQGQQEGQRDADIGADHQGDVREASNRDEGAGQSVGGTTASLGRMRFADGNKRTALYLIGLLALRSGYEFVEDDEVIADTITSVARGETDYEDLAEWFRPRLVRLGE